VPLFRVALPATVRGPLACSVTLPLATPNVFAPVSWIEAAEAVRPPIPP
jgi:hypothetical protein